VPPGTWTVGELGEDLRKPPTDASPSAERLRAAFEAMAELVTLHTDFSKLKGIAKSK
jgi:hypothetical protein